MAENTNNNREESYKEKVERLEKIRSQLAAESKRYSHNCESDDLFRDLVRRLDRAQQDVEDYFIQRIRQVSWFLNIFNIVSILTDISVNG